MSTNRIQEYLLTIPVVTKFLLVLNIAIHIVLFVTSFPTNYLAINPAIVLAYGEYYRLVSFVFVHSGLLHIGMNMSTLVVLGPALENQYGSMKMIFITAWSIIISGMMFIFLVW